MNSLKFMTSLPFTTRPAIHEQVDDSFNHSLWSVPLFGQHLIARKKNDVLGDKMSHSWYLVADWWWPNLSCHLFEQSWLRKDRSDSAGKRRADRDSYCLRCPGEQVDIRWINLDNEITASPGWCVRECPHKEDPRGRRDSRKTLTDLGTAL